MASVSSKSKTSQNKTRSPLARLEKHVDDLRSAGPAEKKKRRGALATFVQELSDSDQSAIRRGWEKLPRTRQEQLHRALCDLGTPRGPAASLLRGLLADAEAWPDTLPDPPPIDEHRRTAAEWTAIFVRDGWTEDDAKEIAASLTCSHEDLMRKFFLERGSTREQAEAHVTRWRRGSKWSAAMRAIDPASVAVGDQKRNDSLRAETPKIAKHADGVAQALAALIVEPSRAAALADGAVCQLLGTIERVILASQSPVDVRVWRWREVAFVAGELADAIGQGVAPNTSQIAHTAREVAAVAAEARALGRTLRRTRGRPRKVVLDAVEALRARKLTWAQVTRVLDDRGLHLDPHTPENIRKSVLARRRASPR